MESLQNFFKEEVKQLLKPCILLLQRSNKKKTYQKTGQSQQSSQYITEKEIHKTAKITEASFSLQSIPGKVFTKLIQNRMREYVESALGEEQAGFRPGRSTIDQLFTMRHTCILEKA